MNKRNYIIILVLLMVIGFASVATNLIINGTLNLGFNSSKFDTDVIFTKATTPYGVATIEEDEKTITFETELLDEVGKESTLTFDVTNKSIQYDAEATINCGLDEEYKSYSQYVDIEKDLSDNFDLDAGETKTGHVTVRMKKAFNESLTKDITFTCTIVASPKEKTSVGEYTEPEVYKDTVLNGADPVLTSSTMMLSAEETTSKSLIPITLSDDGTVEYADIKEEWYNYDSTKKKWANAVILVDEPSREYKVGNIIRESDIESYFVWIPRYRYQIFDEGNYATYISGEPTEGSKKQQIDIIFESKEVEPATGTTKNSWLTHPAFTNFDVNGIWVGKFETGYKGATNKTEAEKTNAESNNIIVKPNVYSWRYNTMSNMFKAALGYNSNLDSHMIKNTEWGAVAYLSHSVYGINNEVNINNNSAFLTGYSATEETDQSSHPGTYGTDSSVTQPYNTPTGYKASTTGNITGIYDISGGPWERVAAYMDGYGVENSQTTKVKSGFTAEELSTYARYLDVYPSNSTIVSYNNKILGDATGEMGPFYKYVENNGTNYYHNNWYADYSHFVDSTTPWFARGGNYANGVLAGQFGFGRSTGDVSSIEGSRLVLTPQ